MAGRFMYWHTVIARMTCLSRFGHGPSSPDTPTWPYATLDGRLFYLHTTPSAQYLPTLTYLSKRTSQVRAVFV